MKLESLKKRVISLLLASVMALVPAFSAFAETGTAAETEGNVLAAEAAVAVEAAEMETADPEDVGGAEAISQNTAGPGSAEQETLILGTGEAEPLYRFFMIDCSYSANNGECTCDPSASDYMHTFTTVYLDEDCSYAGAYIDIEKSTDGITYEKVTDREEAEALVDTITFTSTDPSVLDVSDIYYDHTEMFNNVRARIIFKYRNYSEGKTDITVTSTKIAGTVTSHFSVEESFAQHCSAPENLTASFNSTGDKLHVEWDKNTDPDKIVYLRFAGSNNNFLGFSGRYSDFEQTEDGSREWIELLRPLGILGDDNEALTVTAAFLNIDCYAGSRTIGKYGSSVTVNNDHTEKVDKVSQLFVSQNGKVMFDTVQDAIGYSYALFEMERTEDSVSQKLICSGAVTENEIDLHRYIADDTTYMVGIRSLANQNEKSNSEMGYSDWFHTGSGQEEEGKVKVTYRYDTWSDADFAEANADYVVKDIFRRQNINFYYTDFENKIAYAPGDVIANLEAPVTLELACGSWKKESEGVYYYLDVFGDRVVNSWRMDGGNYYYLGLDGYMVIDQFIDIGDDTYYVGTDGARYVNKWLQVFAADPHYTRFSSTGKYSGMDELRCYFGSNGRMLKSCTKKIDGVQFTFDENGVCVSEEIVDPSGHCFSPKNLTVSFTDDGSRLHVEWDNDDTYKKADTIYLCFYSEDGEYGDFGGLYSSSQVSVSGSRAGIDLLRPLGCLGDGSTTLGVGYILTDIDTRQISSATRKTVAGQLYSICQHVQIKNENTAAIGTVSNITITKDQTAVFNAVDGAVGYCYSLYKQGDDHDTMIHLGSNAVESNFIDLKKYSLSAGNYKLLIKALANQNEKTNGALVDSGWITFTGEGVQTEEPIKNLKAELRSDGLIWISFDECEEYDAMGDDDGFTVRFRMNTQSPSVKVRKCNTMLENGIVSFTNEWLTHKLSEEGRCHIGVSFEDGKASEIQHWTEIEFAMDLPEEKLKTAQPVEYLGAGVFSFNIVEDAIGYSIRINDVEIWKASLPHRSGARTDGDRYTAWCYGDKMYLQLKAPYNEGDVEIQVKALANLNEKRNSDWTTSEVVSLAEEGKVCVAYIGENNTAVDKVTIGDSYTVADKVGIADGHYFFDTKNEKTYRPGNEILGLTADLVLMEAHDGSWVREGEGIFYYENSLGYKVKNEWKPDAGRDGTVYYYYLGSDGYMKRNSFVETGGKIYYVGDDGARFVDKWLTLSDAQQIADLVNTFTEKEKYAGAGRLKFRFGPNGEMYRNVTKEINGNEYTFDENGVFVENGVPADLGTFMWLSSDVEVVHGAPGCKVNVDIHLDDMAGHAGGIVTLQWPEDSFTFAGASDGHYFSVPLEETDDPANFTKKVTLMFDPSLEKTNVSGEGVIATVTLECLDDAAIGERFIDIAEAILVDAEKPLGQGEDTIEKDSLEGISVNVLEMLYGDLYMDGKISQTDLAILRRCLAGWTEWTDVVNWVEADIDKNDDVDMNDVAILSRYISHWTGYERYFEGEEKIRNEWRETEAGFVYYDGRGRMVTSALVEYEGDLYWCGADGIKVTNQWVNVPADDVDREDLGVEYRRYYFNSKGKACLGKKTIEDKTYFFDQTGKMLFGYVDGMNYAMTTEVQVAIDYNSPYEYYCGTNEEGWAIKNQWREESIIYDYGAYKDSTVFWTYYKSNGKRATALSDPYGVLVGEQRRFFDEYGKMLTGWQMEQLPDGSIVAHYLGNEGIMRKKAWAEAKPIYGGDDKEWFYFDSAGNALNRSGVYKINGNFYAFGEPVEAASPMLTGFVSLELPNGSDVLTDALGATALRPQRMTLAQWMNNVSEDVYYFDEPPGDCIGALLKNTDITVNFLDNTCQIHIDATGRIANGYDASVKKYYRNGILMKASKDLGYEVIQVREYDVSKYVLLSADGTAVTEGIVSDNDGSYYCVNEGSIYKADASMLAPAEVITAFSQGADSIKIEANVYSVVVQNRSDNLFWIVLEKK